MLSRRAFLKGIGSVCLCGSGIVPARGL
ncbi:twin-arginine translocation signal domain-containing protein [Microbulbifer sp. CnH-101-G]